MTLWRATARAAARHKVTTKFWQIFLFSIVLGLAAAASRRVDHLRRKFSILHFPFSIFHFPFSIFHFSMTCGRRKSAIWRLATVDGTNQNRGVYMGSKPRSQEASWAVSASCPPETKSGSLRRRQHVATIHMARG